MEQADPAKLAPSVSRPRPRLRLSFVVALLLVMAGAVTMLLLRSRPSPEHHAKVYWWSGVAQNCTPLAVDVTITDQLHEPAQQAICLAVAGKIDRARTLLQSLDRAERANTVGELFTIAHPIADRGDDRSAGPIMKLVVEMTPENYMAVFHAGMADFALGNDDEAKSMLERFLTMYTPADIWRERATNALSAIARHAPVSERDAHFAE